MAITLDDFLAACRELGIDEHIGRMAYDYRGERADIMPDGRTATVERIIERAEVWARAL